MNIQTAMKAVPIYVFTIQQGIVNVLANIAMIIQGTVDEN